MPLRVSKTNIAKEKRERLTLTVFPTTPIPIMSWLQSTAIINGKEKGRMFNINTRSCNYHYGVAAHKLGWEVAPSGHSFRVSYVCEAIKAGASDEMIIENCRWSSGAMLSVYRTSSN